MKEKSKFDLFFCSVFSKSFEKLSKFILVVMVVFIAPLLIRNYKALQQPVALVFFIIIWIASLYFLLEKKLEARGEKRKFLIRGLVNFALVVCGIFIMVTSPENRGIGTLTVVIFGLSLLNAIRKYMKA